MRSNSHRKLLVVVGVILIVTALGLVCFNLDTQDRAGDSSQVALNSLKEVAHWATSNTTLPQNDTISVDETEPTQGDLSREEDIVPEPTLYPDEMPEQEIDGVSYIGYIKIPALELELPVISTSTYPYLKIAPCRFYGSVYLNNFVIGAHNYKTHFGSIKNLAIGDQVIFTDMLGNMFIYEVAFSEILQPDESEILCNGQWPLSLYTCTIGGQARVTVRCNLIQEAPANQEIYQKD